MVVQESCTNLQPSLIGTFTVYSLIRLFNFGIAGDNARLNIGMKVRLHMKKTAAVKSCSFVKFRMNLTKQKLNFITKYDRS